MKKNDIIQLKIDGYGEGGEGVARHEGMAVFVPFTIKGEIVKAKIILLKKSYAIGKLEEILEPSSDRVTPKCSVFTKCGGCQLQHMNETAQAEFKKGKVKECMTRIAFLNNEPSDTVSGNCVFRYRNKLQLPLADNNGLVGGFFAPYSHRIIEIKDCEIQDETSIKILHALKEYANENNVKGYSEFDHKGLLRHLVTRNSKCGTLITLVLNGTALPNSKALVAKLDNLKIPYGLYINENQKQTNVITGDKFTYISGQKSIEASENGVKYTIVPQSFLQINEEIKEKIYQDVVDKAEITQNDTVINAYSGAGLLTAYLAKSSKHAYGVEIISEATESANELARLNNLSDKMTNITGDCRLELKKLIPKLQKEREQNRIYHLNHTKNLENSNSTTCNCTSENSNSTTCNCTSEKANSTKCVETTDPDIIKRTSEKANSTKCVETTDPDTIKRTSEKANSTKCVETTNPDTIKRTILENLEATKRSILENSNKCDGTGKIIFILDPPRKGVDVEILQELKVLKPDKIIYISCNPATLARDIGILCGTLIATANGVEKSQTPTRTICESQNTLNGNQTESNPQSQSDYITTTPQSQSDCITITPQSQSDCITITPQSQSDYIMTTLIPYDMFPQTSHVEVLVCLTRK